MDKEKHETWHVAGKYLWQVGISLIASGLVVAETTTPQNWGFFLAGVVALIVGILFRGDKA